MIIRVAVSPRAGSAPQGSTIADGGKRERLWDALMHHGICVFTERADVADLLSAFKRAGVGDDELKNLVSKVNAVVADSPYVSRPPEPLSEIRTTDALLGWVPHAQLVMLEPDEFDALVGDPTLAVWRTDGMEVVRSRDYDTALVHRFPSRVRVRTSGGGPTLREELWSSWFEPLAKHHRQLTLVDAYLGKSAVMQSELRRSRFVSAGELKELPWLIARIAELGYANDAGLKVKLVTVADVLEGREYTHDEILEAVTQAVKAGLDDCSCRGVRRNGLESVVLCTHLRRDRQHDRVMHWSSPEGRVNRFIHVSAGFDALRHGDLTRESGVPPGPWLLVYWAEVALYPEFARQIDRSRQTLISIASG